MMALCVLRYIAGTANEEGESDSTITGNEASFGDSSYLHSISNFTTFPYSSLTYKVSSSTYLGFVSSSGLPAFVVLRAMQ